MMPWTADGFGRQQSVRQRTTVVGTGGGNGKNLGPGAGQQHRLIADMADQHAPVGKFGVSYALRQVGTGRRCLLCAHAATPMLACARPTRTEDRGRWLVKDAGAWAKVPGQPRSPGRSDDVGRVDTGCAHVA